MEAALARDVVRVDASTPHLVPVGAEPVTPGGDGDDETPSLSDLERSVLQLEARFPRHSARKDERIRRELKVSTTRYYQILGTLIEKPEALAFDPTLVARLRRLQHTRASERLARREIRQSISRATQEKIR